VAIRIVRLGSARAANEGLRVGTVRRPPRGVPRSEFARQNWYDVWYPNLAPGDATLKFGQQAASAGDWKNFTRRYRAEMKKPDAARSIALLAALSQHADFSVGCYCEDEARCHRSILRELLKQSGAKLA
jgi:uncharacterized protein YeaO (DUF488 family)